MCTILHSNTILQKLIGIFVGNTKSVVQMATISTAHAGIWSEQLFDFTNENLQWLSANTLVSYTRWWSQTASHVFNSMSLQCNEFYVRQLFPLRSLKIRDLNVPRSPRDQLPWGKNSDQLSFPKKTIIIN